MLQNKLDPALKKEWIAALRSGQYIQAKKKLYDRALSFGIPRMCCLGVFEHICGNSLDNLFDVDGEMPSELERRMTPEDIMTQKYNGIKLDGSYHKGTLESYLAHLNDGGKSFEEIALFIEENL